MSSVLTPRPCRTPYSSSPKSSPTGPTTRTSVKNDAASEKWTADPPSMRSRCPNGVCTASKAIEPTTTRLMRSRRLAAVDRDPAPRHRRGLHDRRRRLPQYDEAVDHFLEVRHVAHVRLHEVAVIARDPVALDDLLRRAREIGHVRELPGCWSYSYDHGQGEPERARVDVRLIRAQDAVGFESLHPLRDRRRREADTAPQFGQRQACVSLQLAENSAVGRIELRTEGPRQGIPLKRSHGTRSTEGRPFPQRLRRGTVDACGRSPHGHRRRRTSSSARSFTTLVPPSPSCCSLA